MPRHLVFTFAGLALSFLPTSAPGDCLPTFVRELEAIPVYDNTGTAEGAWNGGWQHARPQLLDHDGDGDLDLVVPEETGKLRYLRNDGTESAPDFRLVTDDFAGGVHGFFFARMVDIDTDGDWDLLVQAPSFTVLDGGILREFPGAYLYTNTGTRQNPIWTNRSLAAGKYLIDYLGRPIPFATTSPDFTDIDQDGDPDLLLGDPSGRIILYRNIGSPTSPVFRFETSSYADVTITPDNCFPVEPVRRRPGWLPLDPPSRHGFMLFTFFDVTGSGRDDLFVGDQFNPNVYHYRNVGGVPNPPLSCQTQYYFPDSTGAPVEFGQQRFVPAFGDLDGDGDPDALLGSATDSYRGFRRYENVGTLTAPAWRLRDDDYLPEYDGGLNSAPAMADLDGDLDPDLYVGFGTLPRVSRFQNEGSPGAPVLVELYADWLPLPGLSWLAPEFADLDDDGDMDLFVGTNRGDVRWFRNDGGPPGAVEVTDDTFGVNRLIRRHADSDAVPRFLDADGDDDLDLIVGSFDFQGDPRLRYFRNDGGAASPQFVFAAEDFQGLGSMGQRLAPALGDLDGDGDDDLVVGRFDGTIAFFRNVSTASVPVFSAKGALPGIDVGANSVPFPADLDGDGRTDLLVGEQGGGLNHYRNTTSPANPSAFALLDPAPGGDVEGESPYRFDWEPSIDPVTSTEVATYELRLAVTPTAPANAWRVIGPLSTSEADVTVQTREFRYARDFYWTVAAGDPCRSAPVPAWRHAVNTTAVSGPQPVLDGLLQKPGGGGDEEEPPPAAFGIPRAYPVPALGDVTVEVAMREAGSVRVTVYDSVGRRVVVLHDGPLPAGTHPLVWNGRTAHGDVAAPGVYLVRAESGGLASTRRLVTLR